MCVLDFLDSRVTAVVSSEVFHKFRNTGPKSDVNTRQDTCVLFTAVFGNDAIRDMIRDMIRDPDAHGLSANRERANRSFISNDTQLAGRIERPYEQE